jgi:hypothetical protein
MMGKVLYLMKNYDLSISYLEKVFKEVNYDLSLISSFLLD